MDGAYAGTFHGTVFTFAMFRMCLALQGSLQQFVKCGLKLLSAGRPSAFLGVPQRGDAGGFFDDDQIGIEMANADILLRRRGGAGKFEQLNDFAAFELATFIDAQIAVDLHVAAQNQPLCFGPTHILAAQTPDDGGEGLFGIGWADMVCLMRRHGRTIPTDCAMSFKSPKYAASLRGHDEFYRVRCRRRNEWQS